MNLTPVVHVVDDDADVRKALARLMESAGQLVESHASAEAFLAAFDAARPCCLVLDLRTPGESGLALQARLARLDTPPPIIMISGHGDVPAAVAAMRSGAVDFLPKPYDPRTLLERVEQALVLATHRRQEAAERAARVALLNRLSPREREVFDRPILGETAKQIAAALKLSRKTVDIHRAHIMMKLGVESVAELVHIALAQYSASPNR